MQQTNNDTVGITEGSLEQDFGHMNKQLMTAAARRILMAGGKVFMADIKQIGKDEDEDKILAKNVLWNAYLKGFPEEHRQHHNCHCCKDFIRKIGALVTIEPISGKLTSVFWDESAVSEYFQGPVRALREIVESSKVDHIVYRATKHVDIGAVIRGGFNHFYATFQEPTSLGSVTVAPIGYREVHSQELDTKETHRILSSTLNDFTDELIDEALTYFERDQDLRSRTSHQQTLGWLKELRAATRVKGVVKTNIVWHAVASNGPIRTRYRNSVIGEFLENLSLSNFAVAKRKFISMTSPENYYRPKAAPTEGNIAQAEKIVAAMGIQNSLKRRHLRFDEVPDGIKLWMPTAVEEPQETGSVFGHLQAKDTTKRPAMPTIEGGKITWDRFESSVLPTAKSLDILFNTHQRHIFGSLMTAEDAEAPPILRWDSEEQRNPVSSYVLHEDPDRQLFGTLTHMWGLGIHTGKTRVAVKAIAPVPQCWYKPDQDATRILMLAEGKMLRGKGLALFPEDMRPELREVRSTIEAFSNAGTTPNLDEGIVSISTGRHALSVGMEVEVNDGKAVTRYIIDRGQ